MTKQARHRSEDPGQYGAFAEDYETILVPRYYEEPGRDLLAMARLRDSDRILDIGTGTGILLDQCAQLDTRPKLVAGADLSPRMLSWARTKGHRCLSAGEVPGLPFTSATFDVVTASFVLSHLQTVESSLQDMVRVLRPGGRLAVSGWGTHDDILISTWMETAGEFVDLEQLGAEVRKALPHASTFETLEDLQLALENAGLTDFEARVETYPATASVEEYIMARAALVHSRMMADRLTDIEWQEFLRRVQERLARDFSEPLRYSTIVNLVAGHKPFKA